MDYECQRFLPSRSRRRRVYGTTVDDYVKFAGIFQSAPKMQGGNAVFPDDLEVSVIVAPRDTVIHVLALDGGLQLDDSCAMPRLAQIDFKRVLHSVMMSLRPDVSTFLRYSASSRLYLFARGFISSASSVSPISVYLAGETSFCGNRLLVDRRYVIRIRTDLEGRHIADVFVVASLR